MIFAVGVLHQHGVLQQIGRHRLYQLQHPGIAVQTELHRAHQGIGHDGDRPRKLRLLAWCGRLLLLAHFLQPLDIAHHGLFFQLLQHLGTGRLCRCGKTGLEGRGNLLTRLVPQHQAIGILLAAQPIQRQPHIEGGLRAQRIGGGLAFAGRIRLEGIQHTLPQTQAGAQGALDLDVEPTLNRARHELIGHQIQQRAGYAGHQHEHQRQLQQQAAAEFAAPQATPQPQHQPEQHQTQQGNGHGIGHQQVLVIAFIHGAVGCLRQQKHQDQGNRHHQHDARKHRPAGGAAVPELLEPVCRCHGWIHMPFKPLTVLPRSLAVSGKVRSTSNPQPDCQAGPP